MPFGRKLSLCCLSTRLTTLSVHIERRSIIVMLCMAFRTGCQWNALNATGVCTSSSTHRRFQEWRDTGIFERFWLRGCWLACDINGWLPNKSAFSRLKNPTDRAIQGVKHRLLRMRIDCHLLLYLDKGYTGNGYMMSRSLWTTFPTFNHVLKRPRV